MMKVHEELESKGIEECPECHNLVSDDWDYVDFSNKTVTKCPQCRHRIFLEED